MPHSTSPKEPPHMDEPDQEVLPDAPAAQEDQVAEPQSPSKTKTDNDNSTSNPNDEEVPLEELLFNDDDDDDDEKEEELPASSATAQPISIRPAAPSAQVESEAMYAFYQRLFPFRHLFQWLNHGVKPCPDFGNREFAFTLQNDAYLRYQSFQTADLLRKDILRLNPSRFEIGPVYSTNPRDRKTLRKASAFRPVSKELVFDIDLTDYDDVRTCCSKANICTKCWTFVTMAIRVIDVALREDFGFEHILWVYSGRRGAHAWICDERARNLPDDRRRAIANYLEVVRGGNQSGKRVNLKRPLHPHIARSLEILKPYFASTILGDQDTFQTPEQARRLLELLPDQSLKTSLQKKWESAPDRFSENKWKDIDVIAKTGGAKTLDTKALLEAKQDIVLEYTYPRLDAEVSKKLIHLLKSPFVVHPGTGRVCVPIDPRNLENFNPLTVPTVSGLLDEINAWDPSQENQSQHQQRNSGSASPRGSSSPTLAPDTITRKIHDYEKTSLKPYIDYFRSFVAELNRDTRAGKRSRNEDDPSSAMEF